MNKVQKKLVEVVLFMAGILMYHVNIFGTRDLHELNRKIGELLAAMSEIDEYPNP